MKFLSFVTMGFFFLSLTAKANEKCLQVVNAELEAQGLRSFDKPIFDKIPENTNLREIRQEQARLVKVKQDLGNQLSKLKDDKRNFERSGYGDTPDNDQIEEINRQIELAGDQLTVNYRPLKKHLPFLNSKTQFTRSDLFKNAQGKDAVRVYYDSDSIVGYEVHKPNGGSTELQILKFNEKCEVVQLEQYKTDAIASYPLVSLSAKSCTGLTGDTTTGWDFKQVCKDAGGNEDEMNKKCICLSGKEINFKERCPGTVSSDYADKRTVATRLESFLQQNESGLAAYDAETYKRATDLCSKNRSYLASPNSQKSKDAQSGVLKR